MIRLLLLCVILCASVLDLPARRTSQSVRSEKDRTVRQITETNRKISANEARTERQLAQLQSVSADIVRQTERLADLGREREALDARVAAIEDTVAALDARIARLKESYAKALRSLRRQRSLASKTSALFASESALQASRRLRYLDQLSRWEQKQAVSLRAAITEASEKRDRLAEARAKVEANETEQQARIEQLSQKQQTAQELVASLRRQGKSLRDVLQKQKERADALEQELQRIIDEEAREAARKGREPVAPEQQPVGTDFAAAKGSLRLPLDRGADIVAGFGRRTHEEFEKVEVQNNGIDFEAPAGANAVAVFPGVVSMVIVMQGYNNVVLVRHGEYLTVYAGLTDVTVRKGDKVKAGEVLGKVVASPADPAKVRLHFEVRHEKDKLNPEEWIRQ